MTVLSKAERLLALRLAQPSTQSCRGKTITLVGAGIVNLVTAWQLTNSGYQVQIADAGPDPRDRTHWSRYGCTMAGANARMFTFTEADVYHSGDGPFLFGKPAERGGWRARTESSPLSPQESLWLSEQASMPGWLAEPYCADVYHFNREADRLWRRLRSASPGLFESVDLRDGIIRLYPTHTQVERDLARHRRLHLTTKLLTPRQLSRWEPALADACGQPDLVAAALEVPGFTLDVHKLVLRLIKGLESAGVVMRWRSPVQAIESDASGNVVRLVTDDGGVESDHYVISPGLPTGDLLRGTKTAGMIQGVLGVWLDLPHVDPPPTRSFKLTRLGHLAEDTNITVTSGGLILGAGYGWTGTSPHQIDQRQLALIASSLRDTAQRYLPKPAAAAASRDAQVRYCVRPWTASSLGIFESRPTTRGGRLVITGGHNTGGFAQAPAVASAVLAALRGRRHLMHGLYHPERMRRLR